MCMPLYVYASLRVCLFTCMPLYVYASLCVWYLLLRTQLAGQPVLEVQPLLYQGWWRVF
jgi:hypothetical protein